MSILLFWMGYPPDPNLEQPRWDGFRETMGNWLALCVILAVAAIVLLYRVHAGKKRIRRPSDLFAPYTPMRWLWLAAAPAVVLFVVYHINYQSLFPNAQVSSMAGAVAVAVWGGLLTLAIAFILICTKVATPSKYRYRPVPFLFGKKRKP